ncbi:hypothetical protein [Streptomyces sp. NPDC059165]|uniref:hypothetical protein n=1 Tax=Streptomyces sp. NPDC059165 TaxID=3346751 RepID=UPI0036940ACF
MTSPPGLLIAANAARHEASADALADFADRLDAGHPAIPVAAETHPEAELRYAEVIGPVEELADLVVERYRAAVAVPVPPAAPTSTGRP